MIDSVQAQIHSLTHMYMEYTTQSFTLEWVWLGGDL